MTEKTLIVENQNGIHARPSAAIVGCVSKYESVVTLKTNDGKADARSIMEILMLKILFGTQVTVIADGSDEEQVIVDLEQLFKDHFGVKE